jgi:phosphopantothenoylcysteine decarboxylase/phosphopantothenate--cysteine ligase
VVLGVTGSIAAYKALEIVRRLKERGAQVSVVMTRSAQKLVTPLSFESVSGNRVYTDMWSRPRPASAGPWRMEHIDLAQSASLVLAAPATANLLGKIAAGIADDLLSTVIMATRAPVLFAPAMNNQMWANPVVRQNTARLKELGYHFVEPESGPLACGTEGPGRLAAVETICDAVWAVLNEEFRMTNDELRGKTVVVTTGRTEEELDPVRVITNRSSGKLGIAIAQAARLAGARVKLVAGKTSMAIPAGLDAVRVASTEEMLAALRRLLPEADVLVMAAAPADFRPLTRARDKRKDKSIKLDLERTPDILVELGRVKHHARLVGFALESRNLVANARTKLQKKNLDMIVANPVPTIDSETIRATLVRSRKPGVPGPAVVQLPTLSKPDFAVRLVAEIARLLRSAK